MHSMNDMKMKYDAWKFDLWYRKWLHEKEGEHNMFLQELLNPFSSSSNLVLHITYSFSRYSTDLRSVTFAR
jgi:hypothetical protein